MGRRGKMVGRWNYDWRTEQLSPSWSGKRLGGGRKRKREREGRRRDEDAVKGASRTSKLTLRLTSATKVKISLEVYSKLY